TLEQSDGHAGVFRVGERVPCGQQARDLGYGIGLPAGAQIREQPLKTLHYHFASYARRGCRLRSSVATHDNSSREPEQQQEQRITSFNNHRVLTSRRHSKMETGTLSEDLQFLVRLAVFLDTSVG